MPSRRRTTPPAGPEPRRTTARKCCTTSPRTSRHGARSSAVGSLELTGDSPRREREVALSIERIYTYAAWADKYDGLVHHTPFRNVTLAMPEPIGTIAVVCPDRLAVARLRLDGVAAYRDGKYGRRRSVDAGPARGHRLLSGARHLRRAGWGGEHRHGSQRRADAGARRARRRRRHVVLRDARRGRRSWSGCPPGT